MIGIPPEALGDEDRHGPPADLQQLVDWLLRRPLIPLTCDVNNTTSQIVTGPCLFYGGAFRESAGIATTFDFLDGSGAGGQTVASDQVALNAAAHIIAPPPGILVTVGLVVTVTGGHLVGAVWVQI